VRLDQSLDISQVWGLWAGSLNTRHRLVLNGHGPAVILFNKIRNLGKVFETLHHQFITVSQKFSVLFLLKSLPSLKFVMVYIHLRRLILTLPNFLGKKKATTVKIRCKEYTSEVTLGKMNTSKSSMASPIHSIADFKANMDFNEIVLFYT
jgi:hypothetical protein